MAARYARREQAVLQLREQLFSQGVRPSSSSSDLFARRKAAGWRAGTVLPVQGKEGLTDLLEHGAGAGVALPGALRGARCAEAALQPGGFAARHGRARHAALRDRREGAE